MPRLDLRQAFRVHTRGESFEAEFQTLSPLVLQFEMNKIVEAMAEPLTRGVRDNLLAGKGPDGQGMPRRESDGQPRGVRTGLLARSIAARSSPTGLQLYAAGERGQDGAVMRTFYGKFKIQAREVTRLVRKRGKLSGVTTMRTAGTPVTNRPSLFWKQPFAKDAVKRAIRVIVENFHKYR